MKRSVIFFAACFPVVLLIALAVSARIEKQQEKFILRQAKVIQYDVNERLRHYFSDTMGARLIATTFWEQKNVEQREYEALAERMIIEFPEIHGVNVLDAKGKIVRVYPLTANKGALGLVTQNLSYLQQSLAKGDKYWFSHPFDLFQKGRGFACYLPLKRAGQHLGWLAILITTDTFFKQLTQNEFGKNFNIEIIDVATKTNYISSEKNFQADPASVILKSRMKEFGRDLEIIIWPKEEIIPSSNWILPSLLAFVFTLLMSTAFYAWDQRAVALKRMEELNHLLRLTIHDTASSLTSIMGYLEIMKTDPTLVPIERLSRHVGFVVDLLEQMKLARKLSSDQSQWKMEDTSLLPIVTEISEIMTERLKNKNLMLQYDPVELSQANLKINRGLFAHSILGNVVTNAIKFSPRDGVIKISYFRHPHMHELMISDQGLGVPKDILKMFESGKVPHSMPGTEGEKGTGFGLLIAQQVMELHNGHIQLEKNASGGTVVHLTLPA